MKALPFLALLLPTLAACAPPYKAAAAVEVEAASAAATTTEKSASAPVASDTAEIAAVREKLAKTLQVKADSIRPASIPGFYEIQAGMNFGYVSADGEYMIEGDLVNLSTGESLTETSRKKARLAALEKLGADNFIEFAAANPRHVITVFTDVDCGYCRLLHSQMAGYNAQGITVRYAFFPRTGPDTESFHKAQAVYCSTDRKAALTKAKLNGSIASDASCKNPVLDQYMTALSIGVHGTPAIVLENGELVQGYQPPDRLAQVLDARNETAKAAPGG